jgi:acyl dehydratase/RimJ/RimL family protein N-acetyltransferase
LPETIELRPVVESDLPIFFEQQTDPEATRMAAFPARTRDAFIRHWRHVLNDESVLLKTILYNGEIAGHIVSFKQLGEREVGYWLGRQYWGKGIATHALREFLKEVKTRPLYAHVAKHNIGSKRVLEKCGFTIIAEDRFFSKAFGNDIEEYILKLDEDQQESRMSSIRAGDKASRTTTVTDEMIRAFSDLTGDTNPVHLDDAYASGTRFGRRIAHGMIAAGLISATLANDLPGPGTVYLSQTLQFRAPVYPGDTITATVEVKSVRPDKPIITLGTVCTNQDDKVVLEGEAVVLVDPPTQEK